MRVVPSTALILASRLVSLGWNFFPPMSANAVPLCDVLSSADQYDGKNVTVRGLYRWVLHSSVLISPYCRKSYVNVRQAPKYSVEKHASKVLRSATKHDEFQPVEVVIRGTFRSAKQGECFGQNCLHYEIEARELLSAEIPKNVHISNQRNPEH